MSDEALKEEVATLETGSTVEPIESSQDSESAESPDESWKVQRFDKVVSQKNHIKDLLTEEKQKAQQLEAELQTYKAKFKPEKEEVEIPPVPESDLQFDDPEAYKQALKSREDAIYAKALRDADEKRRAEADETRQKEQQDKEVKRNQEIVSSYVDKGLEAGLSEDKMSENENILRMYGAKSDLVKELYADEQGAQLVDYVADNPALLKELNSMTPFQAARMIEKIRPDAVSTKPTYSNAPDPIETTSGASVAPKNEWDQLAEGASFS